MDVDLCWPFGTLDGLDSNDIQTTAYEIFFTSCRSSPGFGGRNAIQFYSSSDGEKGVNSRFKRAVGLKMLKRTLSSRGSINPLSTVATRRPKRPLTSAEIMRQQMKVSESSDNRLQETCILDEVDQLLELMKKTWTTLGFNKPMHDLCFTWVLFQQYVMTGQVEKDLLSASLTMLTEVANDSNKVDVKEPVYVKMLSSVLTSVNVWCEKRLMDYHGSFSDRAIGVMDNILPLVFTATRILEEIDQALECSTATVGNKVDQYTRSSLKNAFAKVVEKENQAISRKMSFQQVCKKLVRLAQETEDLAFKEKMSFSIILKKWHPISAGVAAVTLHSCYGALLKQFLTCNSDITSEMLTVLQRADKLEKVLVNMVVEDSVECEDGGMTVVREMVLYEVDSIILKFLGQSVHGRLKKIKAVLHKDKETETWNPKSKTEPYSQSAVDLMKHARELVTSFFDIPVAISEDLVREFADGIEKILEDYVTFVASCGSKDNYIPPLPPLTRCSRDSKLIKLWKKATPCAVAVAGLTMNVTMSPIHLIGLGLEEEVAGSNHPRPSTSRGTQRLYIRLNTLQYIISQLPSLEKCLFFHSTCKIHRQHFDHTRFAIMAATHHVCEVAAYRLIFLDSNSVMYGSLYEGHVVNARISPNPLRVVKQNLTLLSAIVTDPRAQGLAIRQVMKASFEAFLMVLIAGGGGRIFTKADHEMIEEDLKHLKDVFAESGVVESGEAETVESVVQLMGKPTEQLVEEFRALYMISSSSCEDGIEGEGQSMPLPLPPTTGRWNNSDPNTILRVLCHRKDQVANLFLKTTFHLAKRT
ncbi:hypothetical protein QVD17_11191 [Tagetes erecta]|uniref:MHD1 domain-containing protein n=1 Tax=Tagetes erecta TaxID=13708 RepID=A0AAD8KTT4_TARER|nr:hypothetical protein QVD17_11191 [Tagetes erecta]